MVALRKNTGRKGVGETFTFTVVFIGGIYICVTVIINQTNAFV